MHSILVTETATYNNEDSMPLTTVETTIRAGELFVFIGFVSAIFTILFRRPTRDHRGTKALKSSDILLLFSLATFVIGILTLLIGYTYSTASIRP